AWFHGDPETYDERLAGRKIRRVSSHGGACLCSGVSMYGGLWCWESKTVENHYYHQARDKPSPLADDFDAAYFATLADDEDVQGKSAKALLATEQRIPGQGNGVLRDFLFAGGIHPKRKVQTLSAAERKRLFRAIRRVLADMAKRGGRDTEKDLFGEPGRYQTKLSRLTVGSPCAKCDTPILKQNYLGGSVYVCETCQPLTK
ncbi:MAG TPA: endonuclease VIII, partial [Candidatus Latescibacteria bacterium]|nr:endonuclease VIII [Candidatus Latescibacterota bacterium]